VTKKARASRTAKAGKPPGTSTPPGKTTSIKTLREKTTKKSQALIEKGHGPLCIVGLGASAGGLEALEGFFSNMPSDSNMAFVVIQHLSPGRKSIMDSLLARYTGMFIRQMEDGMKVEPNCIYLNQPAKDTSLMNGVLYLTEPRDTHAARMPIDHFLRSLAQDQKEKAVCIVLSGTGSDGTLGLKEVKGEGGMTMAQEESQAKYDSMPRSAINTGLVDFILPVEKMSADLIRYVRHPYIEGEKRAVTPGQEYLNAVSKIFLLIRSSTGHDFSNYKQNTIRRRIERRMAVHQLDRITDYLRYLQENPAEVETLYKDMLIGVTNFFRDPDAFEVLSSKVVPSLLEGKKPDSTLRAWVTGCATGEEAYSIAMVIQENMDQLNKHVNVQIFATDIDAEAVEIARAGAYPDSIAADITAGRLQRFFTKVDDTYIVKKQIREMVVFAVQNIIKDPPFSRLDLVSCRNVLIYMDSVLQKKVLPLFHYVLNHDGFLFLGSSESIGEFADFFSPVSAKWKIFRRKGIAIERAIEHRGLPFYETAAEMHREEGKKVLAGTGIRQLAESLILREYAPPCVLINEKNDIVYFHGKTDIYLSPPAGEPSFNILKMAQEDLRYSLSILLYRAMKQKKTAASEGVRIKHDGRIKTIDLVVRPLADPMAGQGLMMVIFDDKTAAKIPLKKEKKAVGARETDTRIAALQQELNSTKEYLQTTIEELETSNEELKSTNEELQSTNEELQSTNEEMETSKEELQSTNEELETVNTELQSKVEQLSTSNNDLNNLLASTDIGTVFLDTRLQIRRFTPSVARIFNLIRSDIGRPIGDITLKTDYGTLSGDVREVLASLVPKECEIKTTDGTWFAVRILPYRTVDNVIDGVVITFIDITTLKEATLAEKDARVFAEGIIDTVREPLVVLDEDMRVISANKSFFGKFKVQEDDTINRSIFDLGNRQWDIPDLRKLLNTILPEKTEFQDFEVKHDFPFIGKKTMLLNARQVYSGAREKKMVLLAFEDITGLKQSGDDLKKQAAEE
jgi:two-component system CheB/CheR fusion protein